MSLGSAGSGNIGAGKLGSGNFITRTLTHSPLIAVVLYLAVTGGLLATAGLSIANILDHQRALAQTSDLLDQLRGRKARGAASASADHPGTPFLEGRRLTVAGAALLQRVATAIGNVGGTIQSSQVRRARHPGQGRLRRPRRQLRDGTAGAAKAVIRPRGRHAVFCSSISSTCRCRRPPRSMKASRPDQGDARRFRAMAGGK